MISRFLKSIAGGSSQHPVNIECSNKLPSSVHAVESNDDLLSEILLHLPVISVLLYKTVSKRWYSIITNPDFSLRHHSQNPKSDPASGLYIKQPGSSSAYDFVPLDIRIPPSNVIFRCDLEVVIIQSCNGLFLCRGTYKYHNDYNYYMYNPTTNVFKKLPPCPINDGIMRMAYDPIRSPHYKMVYATRRDNNNVFGLTIQIYTYSSETGIWSDCSHRYWSKSSYFSLICVYGIYWSNAIHSVDGLNHEKLCLEDLAITSVQLPGKQCFRKLFESRGCLLLVCLFHIGVIKMLNVYEMSNVLENLVENFVCIFFLHNVHSEWSIKYIVHLDEAMRLFPEIGVYPYTLVSTSVRCIVLGKREEDSFMVIDLNGEVMQYKMMSNTLRKLPYFKSVNYLYPRSFQFIASFAGV
ncbi:F-box protein At5g07610-like [Rutidosis leptorrhynchoides]|uniref:F-box protein At5g07610-like n=1 Tax=Rutidosis leptorrhynchoides TaxID=125765 RepID=UPI003A98FC68